MHKTTVSNKESITGLVPEPIELKTKLASGDNLPAMLKQQLTDVRIQLERLFTEGEPVEQLLGAHTLLVDRLLVAAWSQQPWQPDSAIALFAVGGYGREELHPHSDIDLLILYEQDDCPAHRTNIEKFLALLWDMGLNVASSVRTLMECTLLAEKDQSTLTSLLEARLLAGHRQLHLQLMACTGCDRMGSTRDFLRAKREEQRIRHQKYADTEYSLEPNIKNSPGGIRDIHLLGWIAMRHFNTHHFNLLTTLDFLTEDEYQQLTECRNFLWRLRWALHSSTGVCEDRLLFNHQQSLATLFGYRDHDGSLAVEQLMKRYYRTAQTVSRLNDLILQHFDTMLVGPDQTEKIEALNERFLLRNNRLETTSENLFCQRPEAMLELFVLLTENPDIQGVGAATIRQLMQYSRYINDNHRQSRQFTELFLRLLRTGGNVAESLLQMNRYQLLGRYLPEFGQIIGQMQFDLFHSYTVDAHTLLVIKYLCRFREGRECDLFPLAAKLAGENPSFDLLCIAALYHDIGKGRGGDHSELGAVDAGRFCKRHRLDSDSTSLVCWLVQEHLTLSVTAQKKDLQDINTLYDFAANVGCLGRLDALYILTVADINATNPSLWNDWRASLLRQLYTSTHTLLERKSDDQPNRHAQQSINRTKALELLKKSGVETNRVEVIWSELEQDYFGRHTVGEIAWHTQSIIQHQLYQNIQTTPLIKIREAEIATSGGTQIFIHTKDRPRLFALSVVTLDRLGLDIQEAKIVTSRNGFSLDTFTVLKKDGQIIGDDRGFIGKINNKLQRALRQSESKETPVRRRVSQKLKHFAREPEITLSSLPHTRQTLIEIRATDRPGLLAAVAKLFMDLDLNVHTAKIATFGEIIEDRFVVTNESGHPISSNTITKHIQTELYRIVRWQQESL